MARESKYVTESQQATQILICGGTPMGAKFRDQEPLRGRGLSSLTYVSMENRNVCLCDTQNGVVVMEVMSLNNLSLSIE